MAMPEMSPNFTAGRPRTAANRHALSAQAGSRPADDLAQRVLVILSMERRAEGEHFVQGRAERVDVRSMVDRDLLPPRLLRAHVEGRADEISAQGQALLPFEPCEAEVEDAQPSLQAPFPAASTIEDQVRWLDVAVDDALGVRVLEAFSNAGEGLGQ